MPLLGLWGRVLAVTGLTGLLLSGCNLPDDFKVEIRLAEDGRYALSYHGILIWVPLHEEILRGKLKGTEIEEKIRAFENDIKRDSHFRDVRSLGGGRYKMHYQREGRIEKTGQVTFIRRNVALLVLKALPEGTVAVTVPLSKRASFKQLEVLGLSVRGMLRVATGLPVLEHNAQTVKLLGPFRIYEWSVTPTLTHTPRLVARRDG
ncbi:MAG: hypothetical protein FD149_1306 [Rhodospirillaceae bacterium]|nr:MAG: hypothetical protein FD149_1306 [Rhodospirillaceae bacterium]